MKLYKILTWILILCMGLSACGSMAIPTKAPSSGRETDGGWKNSEKEPTPGRTEPVKESSGPGEDPAGPLQPSDTEKAEAFRAYMTFLEENKDSIDGTYYFRSLGKQYNIYDVIMFWDLTGDGIPEMLAVRPGRTESRSDALSLFVYTCSEGQVCELKQKDGSPVIPVFWDQSFFGDMTDPVCFSREDDLYVFLIRRESGSRWERESENLYKLVFDARSGTLAPEAVLQKESYQEYGLESNKESQSWYVNGKETDPEKYEEARTKLFEKAEAGVLIPSTYTKMWYGSRAAESIPSVYENWLGMRFKDAVSFLTGAIEAAEEDRTVPTEVIKLGRFEQDGNTENGAEPIEWLVLAKEDGKALLISRYGLDCQYYSGNIRGNWEDSPVRQWLNGVFYEAAFREEEKAKIVQSRVVSEANPRYGSRNAVVTEDWLFLPDLQEVMTYMERHSLRLCCPSPYARQKGCAPGLGGGTGWILRSFGGYGELSVAYVDNWGMPDAFGTNIDNRYAVRPAMWIEWGD